MSSVIVGTALFVALGLATRIVVPIIVGRIREIFGNNETTEIPQSVHSNQYVLSNEGKEYVDRSKEVLHNVLGDKPVEALQSMETEERKKKAEQLCVELRDLYDLDPNLQIELTYDEKSDVCGYYSKDQNRIVLNCAHLLTDSKDMTRDFLDTIFHEFRHASQWRMIENEGHRFAETSTRRNEFRRNMAHYISPHISPRRYFNQPVELDAREIALYILEDEQ